MLNRKIADIKNHVTKKYKEVHYSGNKLTVLWKM